MLTFYLAVAAVGFVLLVAQLVLGVAGGDHVDLPDLDDSGHTGFADGMELLSVRSLSGAATAFGLTGLALHSVGLSGLLAFPAALLAGFATAVVVVRAQRAMLRLERDHVQQPLHAIGLIASVHVTIPAAGSGLGKVTLELQGHFVELPARTSEPDSLPPGTAVLVTDVSDDGVLDVAHAPALLPETPA